MDHALLETLGDAILAEFNLQRYLGHGIKSKEVSRMQTLSINFIYASYQNWIKNRCLHLQLIDVSNCCAMCCTCGIVYGW